MPGALKAAAGLPWRPGPAVVELSFSRTPRRPPEPGLSSFCSLPPDSVAIPNEELHHEKHQRLRAGEGTGSLPRPVAPLFALRACEQRIRDLQNPTFSRDSAEPPAREARLRAEAGKALRCARACVQEGEFQRAQPVSLAAIMNSFSKMRRHPIVPDVDAIMACIAKGSGGNAPRPVPWRIGCPNISPWWPTPSARAADLWLSRDWVYPGTGTS